MPNKLVGLLYESWADLDRAVSGISEEEATRHDEGGSSIAWTVAHVTQMLDSWLVARFQGVPPHPAISDAAFSTGASGEAEDWALIERSVTEVRRAARRWLEGRPDPDLGLVIPYDGSITYLRPTGLPLSYAVLRIAAHHFTHVGEIETLRSLRGHPAEGSREWGLPLL